MIAAARVNHATLCCIRPARPSLSSALLEETRTSPPTCRNPPSASSEKTRSGATSMVRPAGSLLPTVITLFCLAMPITFNLTPNFGYKKSRERAFCSPGQSYARTRARARLNFSSVAATSLVHRRQNDNMASRRTVRHLVGVTVSPRADQPSQNRMVRISSVSSRPLPPGGPEMPGGPIRRIDTSCRGTRPISAAPPSASTSCTRTSAPSNPVTFTVLTAPGRRWLIKDCMRGSGVGADMEVSLVGAGRTGSNSRDQVPTSVSRLMRPSGAAPRR